MHLADSLDHLFVTRDLAQGGRIRHAGAQGVDGDAVRGELDGELADVGLERRLGRGDRAVGRPDDMVARRGHREDPRDRREEAGEVEILHPVDQRIGHHVHGHFELRLGDRRFPRRAEEGLQRAEGERVEEDRDARLGRIAPAGRSDRRHDL